MKPKYDKLPARLRELRAAGLPTISRAQIPLVIHVIGEPILRVGKMGLTSYVIPLLLCNGPEKLILVGADLELSWEDRMFQFIEQDDGDYRLCGAPRRKYAQQEVLDFSRDPVLEPGESKSGILLASGSHVPPLYEHNTLITATLAIGDHLGGVHTKDLKFRINRSEETQISPFRLGSGLYGGEKPGETPSKAPSARDRKAVPAPSHENLPGSAPTKFRREFPEQHKQVKTAIN